MNRLFRRLRAVFYIDKLTQEFMRHNLSVWKGWRVSNDRKSEILFEQDGAQSSIIAISYLANTLAKKHQAQLVAYRFNWPWKLHWLTKVFPLSADRLYTSFNFSSFLRVNPDRTHKRHAEELFKQVYPGLKGKRQIERLTIDGVWIGDLIYDEYLRQNNAPTIDVNDKEFIKSLKSSLGILVFWLDYLNTHQVKAIAVSHCVYKFAILLRLAVKLGIPAYQINATHIYSLTNDNMFAYTDFLNYRDDFKRLQKSVRSPGIKEARERIKRRLSGEVGVDMTYSNKSAYSGKKSYKVLRASNRKKLLIASHSFFDAPHAYGLNLFPDFYEWLHCLGRISETTDYDWYIKTHPDYFPKDPEVIDYFVKKYPKFTLLSPDTSHHQIIEEGIDFVLTTYGTIGFEYAALGVPVINASVNNPHIAYDFNLHPRTVDEYKSLIENLDSVDCEIDKGQVYEYYFMRHIYNTSNWLFGNYNLMVKELGGYREQFTSRVYKKWLDEYSLSRHRDIQILLKKYISSGDFRLNIQSFNNEKAVDFVEV